MIHLNLAPSSGNLTSLLAELDGGSAVPLLQRLEPTQRVRVMAALAVILTFGGLLLLMVRAGARIARWYIQRPVGDAQLAGGPWQPGPSRVFRPRLQGTQPGAARQRPPDHKGPSDSDHGPDGTGTQNRSQPPLDA
jgi:hypothetical protein